MVEPNYKALIFHCPSRQHVLLSETCLIVIVYQDGWSITNAGREWLSYGQGDLYDMKNEASGYC